VRIPTATVHRGTGEALSCSPTWFERDPGEGLVPESPYQVEEIHARNAT